MSISKKLFAMGAALVAGGLTALAAVTIPNTFTAGTTIKAAEVNANFSSLKAAVDALQAASATYTAGTGLTLAGSAFSVENGGIGNAQLADASVTGSKIGVPLLLSGSRANQNPRGILQVTNTDTSLNGGSNYGTAIEGRQGAGWGFNPLGAGVWGNGQNAIGVLGTSQDSYGLYADSVNGGGLYARAQSSSKYAGEFAGKVRVVGNLEVTGTLSKGGGSFKIDSPTDPKNKILYHSFVESPDMMNVYNGNATLDASGEATVTLPAYFEALNREFRYQLTALGAPGPNLYVAEEVTQNRFKIAGGKANSRVSWQVTGIRHDPYANANRIPNEVEKTPEERGKYLYPDAYGQPASAGINRVDAKR